MDDLARRFNYHPPRDQDIANDHQAVRNQVSRVALDLQYRLPESREKSLAITKLEEAMFWANAAIARIKNYEERDG